MIDRGTDEQLGAWTEANARMRKEATMTERITEEQLDAWEARNKLLGTNMARMLIAEVRLLRKEHANMSAALGAYITGHEAALQRSEALSDMRTNAETQRLRDQVGRYRAALRLVQSELKSGDAGEAEAIVLEALGGWR